MYIPVEFPGGTPIDIAAHDAIVLADKLHCTVKFTFNDVTCFANPGESAAVLAHNWRCVVHRGFHPTCSSHPTSGQEQPK